jgi:hypothetical protein
MMKDADALEFGSFVVKDRKERQGRNPSYRGDHHHRGKTGCGLQAQQGTDGKAGAARDPSDAGSGPMMAPEELARDGGGSWLR